jgi:hypothetical protein
VRAGALLLLAALAACAGGERQSQAAQGNTPAAAPQAAPAVNSANASTAVQSGSSGSVSGTAPPPAGSAQRAAIMDALRPAIEAKFGKPVEFVVRRIGVQDGWALVIADPQRPGGGRIDPRRHFPHEVIEFMDGLTINAVLRFSGGGWTLVDHAVGPTDVWYCGVEGPPRSLTGC